MAIRRFNDPEFMTTEEVMEKFYPNSVLLIRCIVEQGCPVSGFVVAAEDNNPNDFFELQDYQLELRRDKNNGYVHLRMTKDPLEGGALFVEQSEIV